MKRNSPKTNDPVPMILVGLGLVLVIGVLIWQFWPAPTTQAPPPLAGASANGAATPTDIPEGDIRRVSLVDAKTALDGKTAVFVDVRSLDSYQAGHIPGALNIPLPDLESRLNELSPQNWIITYCT